MQGAHTARPRDTSNKAGTRPCKGGSSDCCLKQPHHTAQERPTGRNSVHMFDCLRKMLCQTPVLSDRSGVLGHPHASKLLMLESIQQLA